MAVIIVNSYARVLHKVVHGHSAIKLGSPGAQTHLSRFHVLERVFLPTSTFLFPQSRSHRPSFFLSARRSLRRLVEIDCHLLKLDMGKKTKSCYYAAQNGRDGPMIYRDWKAVSHLFLLSLEHSLMAHVDLLSAKQRYVSRYWCLSR